MGVLGVSIGGMCVAFGAIHQPQLIRAMQTFRIHPGVQRIHLSFLALVFVAMDLLGAFSAGAAENQANTPVVSGKGMNHRVWTRTNIVQVLEPESVKSQPDA